MRHLCSSVQTDTASVDDSRSRNIREDEMKEKRREERLQQLYHGGVELSVVNAGHGAGTEQIKPAVPRLTDC